MSYEEGETFDDSTMSEYKKGKVILLLKCLVRDMEGYQRFLHGDIHKGNWKVRVSDGKDPSVVIYDFGFCWEISENLEKALPLLYIYTAKLINVDIIVTDELSPRIGNLDKKDSENEILHEILYYLFQEKHSIKFISEDLQNATPITDVDSLMKYIFMYGRKNDILLESYLFQSLIIINQMNKYIISGGSKNDTLDIISYCQTHDIFPEYCNFLVKASERSSSQKKNKPFEFRELLQEFL